MKTNFWLFLSGALLVGSLQAAPKPTPQQDEAAVHHYRVTMKEAGEALKNNQAEAAFQKILSMAQQGFPEAQYIAATMLHDGVGTTQDLAAAKKWYSTAANQSGNEEVATLAKEGLAELK